MNERRFHPPAEGVARIPCRVCYRGVDLHPDFIHHEDRQWVMTCPYCACSFPVRVDDTLAARLERLKQTEGA